MSKNLEVLKNMYKQTKPAGKMTELFEHFCIQKFFWTKKILKLKKFGTKKNWTKKICTKKKIRIKKKFGPKIKKIGQDEYFWPAHFFWTR